MPSSSLQHDNYEPVELKHINMEQRPKISQGLSSDTAQSTQVGDDVKSSQSDSPLGTPSTYPPSPSQMISPYPSKRVRKPDEAVHSSHLEHDTERAAGFEGLPYDDPPLSRPPNGRSSGWNIFAGVKKFEHDYEEYDPRNATEAHPAFAEGDVPKDKVSYNIVLRSATRPKECWQLTKLYNFLLNFSIVTRWTIFIIPALIALWIPGILSFTKYPGAQVSCYYKSIVFICLFVICLRYGVSGCYGGQPGLLWCGLVRQTYEKLVLTYITLLGRWASLALA
jgi:hypothetical protein